MLNRLRNFFEGVRDEAEDTFVGSAANAATIRQRKNGKFILLANVNEVVGTYARRRDAVRGAKRKGLYVQD